jgi:hypothetical protein
MLSFTFNWDKDRFLKASKAAYKYEMRYSPKRYIGWLFIALTQFGVVAAMKKGSVGLLFVSTFLVLYWYFLRWPMRRRIIEKMYDKGIDKNHTYHVTVDENGVTIDCKTIPWRDFLSVISLDDGFLLYSEDAFFFFPASAFHDLETKNSFAQLAKNYATSYQKG